MYKNRFEELLSIADTGRAIGSMATGKAIEQAAYSSILTTRFMARQGLRTVRFGFNQTAKTIIFASEQAARVAQLPQTALELGKHLNDSYALGKLRSDAHIPGSIQDAMQEALTAAGTEPDRDMVTEKMDKFADKLGEAPGMLMAVRISTGSEDEMVIPTDLIINQYVEDFELQARQLGIHSEDVAYFKQGLEERTGQEPGRFAPFIEQSALDRMLEQSHQPGLV